jgi:hypothetical protein
MTEREAGGLGEGDVVEVPLGAGRTKWRPARVLSVQRVSYAVGLEDVVVNVRRLKPAGSKHQPPRQSYTCRLVRRPARLDGVTANVFADWLESRGHADAAAALREAFPLVTAEGLPCPAS